MISPDMKQNKFRTVTKFDMMHNKFRTVTKI